MIYNETVVIQNNKAKRIIELCKSLGIELFDSYNKKYRTKEQTSPEKINDYLVEYFQWARLVNGHLENIFLTPRIKIEFEKKDVFGTTFQMNIQAHVENVLAQQIYFLEIVISEIMKYKYSDANSVPEERSIIQRMFTTPAKRKTN